jgi:homoserine kinase
MAEPAAPWVEAFAPATVSNLGPGFDCLGLALHAPGDTVRARRRAQPGVVLTRIEGDGGGLPRDPTRNTAAFAVAELLRRFAPGAGVELELYKGLPLGSGLGSSGASACAALVAAQAALGLGLAVEQLVDPAREAERVACGAAHPDNVAPALLGGIVLVSALDPLRVCALPVPEGLWIAVYTPGHPVSTAEARSVLPARVSLGDTVRQAARLGLLVHALHRGDLHLLGEAIADDIVEPARAHLVPGYRDAKAACVEAGALACSISGAGPTTFALADAEDRARALLGILDESFTLAGVPGAGHVDRVGPGARVLSAALH